MNPTKFLDKFTHNTTSHLALVQPSRTNDYYNKWQTEVVEIVVVRAADSAPVVIAAATVAVDVAVDVVGDVVRRARRRSGSQSPSSVVS